MEHSNNNSLDKGSSVLWIFIGLMLVAALTVGGVYWYLQNENTKPPLPAQKVVNNVLDSSAEIRRLSEEVNTLTIEEDNTDFEMIKADLEQL